jgi:hypothetical protein
VTTTADPLLADAHVAADPIAQELARVVSAPTGTTSAGHPFLDVDAYVRFRDRVPHILAMGPRALAALDVVTAAARRAGGEALVDAIAPATKVVRGCVLTAAITAPSDLWLLRHVIGGLTKVGVIPRLLAGERIDPAACDIEIDAGSRKERVRADARELDADLTLLLSRGYVGIDETAGVARIVAPAHPRARDVLAHLGAAPAWPADMSRVWLAAFRGESLSASDRSAALACGADASALARTDARGSDTWIATRDEIELGFRLLPIVLALRAAGLHAKLASGERIDAAALVGGAAASTSGDVEVGAAALAVLAAAGVVDASGAVTATGKRVGEKGAGPMGIIEAYHPYMARLADILVHGRKAAWVTRGANIAASQDANRDSFQKANDALDKFCAETGFTYRVFIEHAIGRGEATRQRFARSGESVRYFGADLEDAAIDACVALQQQGALPKDMVFVRQADIGAPQPLVDAIRAAGASTEGAVMIVGNGFHEVRNQTDARMIEVFQGYCDAGIVLLFTEENALRVDDLLTTAWNTYHAGFRYVHEKSGQGLRPADPAPPSALGRSLQLSWRECAERAGYVRLDGYSSRSRTIYPLAPSTRTNPTISANHFCVPRRLMP